MGPDGKSQVTVEYRNWKPYRVDAVVISTQHTEEILDKTGKQITKKSKQEIFDKVIKGDKNHILSVPLHPGSSQ